MFLFLGLFIKASVVCFVVLLSPLVAQDVEGASAIFVRANNSASWDGVSDGSQQNPYNSLLIEPVGSGMGLGKPGDNIFILPSEESLEGGVTLQDGQKLRGRNNQVCDAELRACDLSGPISAITNSGGPSGVNGGHGIVLANNNHVSDLYIHDILQGHGIYGSNVTGAKIRGVLVQYISTSLELVPRPSADCDLANAVYRGCSNVVTDFFPLFEEPQFYYSFAFFADDSGDLPVVDGSKTVTHSVQNSRSVHAGPLEGGVYVGLAGEATIDLKVNKLSILGGQGVRLNYFENATVLFDGKQLELDDGQFAMRRGFLGFAPNPDVPVSTGRMVVNIDSSTFVNGGAFNNIALPEALFGGSPPGGSIEFHLQNSDVVNNPNSPFLQATWGESLFDLGCVEDCEAGYTSIGNNNISGNLADVNGYPAQIFIGRVAVVAENNYWGSEDGLGECFVYEPPDGPPPPPGNRCTYTGEGASIDADPFLSEPPDR